MSNSPFDHPLFRRLGQLNRPNALFRNNLDQGAATFTEVTPGNLLDTGLSRTAQFADLNNDGWPDLIIGNVGEPAALYENTTTNQGHWLHVILGPDAAAVGATVRAAIGARTLRRDVIYGRSYLTGTPPEVHFGLGVATSVDTLAIRWNDGTEEIMTNVAGDQILRVCRYGADSPSACAAPPSLGATPTPGPPCFPGDANHSCGFVDAADFSAVQLEFDSLGPPGVVGDADCSGGFVDASDFVAVQPNFGNLCN